MPSIVLAVGLTIATLVVLDRTVAWLDLGYQAVRGRPNEERVLRRSEFAVPVRTNALGFREPQLPSAKRDGTVRVLCLGDSFTQGYGVREREAYPRRLEALPHDLMIMPGAYSGSVCGRALSGNPGSTIGFERRFNKSFAIADESDFVAAMLRDIPPPPPDATDTRAANLGRTRVLL